MEVGILKVIAVSDIHGDARARRFLTEVISKHSPDLLIICGDITTFGPASFAEQLLKNLGAKCAVIPGNCDPEDVLDVIEKHSISLHEKRVEIDGIDFVGMGGSPICTMRTPREMDEEYIEKVLSDIMVENCVLVTHAPPYGINDLTRSGKRLGSRAVERIVRKFHPRIVLSGHVHEAKGITEDNGMIFANPGPLKEGNIVLMDIDHEVSAKIVDLSDILRKL
ncbi:MAG: metallophosphoesterase [Thermoplasmata archaeon]|nr:metallophosphoesterase [Thermoplasmata archaeon]